ncbi:MAG: ADP-ribosylglycohydrolase family protein [Kosmotogaceae bacterium]
MLGAIAGDIIGSVYEGIHIKTTDFPLFQNSSIFTDDTVLTIAVADSILSGTKYEEKLKEYFRRYPERGFGGMFMQWATSENTRPYNSWGNGSAMRVSPVGFAFDSIEKVLEESEKSAAVTHNHPEGIKGAQATAIAIFLARKHSSKKEIKDYISDNFNYDLSESLDSVKEWYSFDVSCQGTVPYALITFLESNDFEDAIRKSISLGGDSDTLACITGGIAQAYYKHIPGKIKKEVMKRLPVELKEIIEKFYEMYNMPDNSLNYVYKLPFS